MMFKSPLISFIGALLLAGQTYAAQKLACPDINDIKAAGLNFAEQTGNFYFGANIDTYNTPSLWLFLIGPIESDSPDEAIETTNEILSNMSEQGVPTDNGQFACLYKTGRPDVLAVAGRDLLVSPLQLKHYILNRMKK